MIQAFINKPEKYKESVESVITLISSDSEKNEESCKRFKGFSRRS